MNKLEEKFKFLCYIPSDINEHLITIKELTQECSSVFETGVRGVVSSYAFLYGLVNNNNNTNKKTLLLNDLVECDINEFMEISKPYNINIKYIWKNNLEIDFLEDENYDLTFIDTWHVYGQLKRELEKFSKITNKYIVMHDTEIDGINGETRRPSGLYYDLFIQDNLDDLIKKTKIPKEEILNGLKPAINEFINNNKDWEIYKTYNNNNGLTILKKKY